MLEKKRLYYVDWLKAIGIYLIVLGHCLPAYTLPRTVIYTFHVPLFAFAGGLLSKKAETPKELLSKLLKLLKRMGIPYLIWFVITSYPYMMKECPFKTDYSFKELVEIFFLLNGRPMWNAALWFIPCYFIVNVIFAVFSYLVKPLTLKVSRFALRFPSISMRKPPSLRQRFIPKAPIRLTPTR